VAGHEIEDQAGQFVDLLVHDEVPGIELLDLGIGQVAAIGFGASGDELGIVGAPGDQCRRPVFQQPGLPPRVGGDIGAVVVEQRRLNLALARLGEMVELIGPA